MPKILTNSELKFYRVFLACKTSSWQADLFSICQQIACRCARVCVFVCVCVLLSVCVALGILTFGQFYEYLRST